MTESNHNFKIVIAVATTAGRTNLLLDTLNSIESCKKTDNFKGVYIVENGGRKGAEQIVQQFDEKYYRYVFLGKSGKSAGLNYLLKKYILHDELIIFTDDDIIVNSQWIENYYHAAKIHGRNHFYGGSFTARYEKEPDKSLKQLLPISARGLTDDEYRDRKIFHGCNWAVFKSDIEQVGLFDENIGPGSSTDSTGQETVLQKKLLYAGLTPVFIKNNIVQHYVPETRSNIQWICHRAVRTGIENAYSDNNSNIKASIYYIIKLSFRVTYMYVRNDKKSMNKYLHTLIKTVTKILIKLNRNDNE